jgi:hypothetical protein
MDWSFPPDIQKRYEEILAQTRRLQKELGITPRTLEERARDYELRKLEEQKKTDELDKFKQLVGQQRPVPKWKL